MEIGSSELIWQYHDRRQQMSQELSFCFFVHNVTLLSSKSPHGRKMFTIALAVMSQAGRGWEVKRCIQARSGLLFNFYPEHRSKNLVLTRRFHTATFTWKGDLEMWLFSWGHCHLQQNQNSFRWRRVNGWVDRRRSKRNRFFSQETLNF